MVPSFYSPKITWLASYPKSGNTWVRMFLSAYVNGYCDINRSLINVSDINRAHYQNCSAVDISTLNRDEIHALRPAMLLNLRTLAAVKPLLVKTHCAVANVGGIAVIPKAVSECAIYIVRDPRDVAISLAEHLDEPINSTIGLMSIDTWTLVGTKQMEGIPQVVMSWSSNVSSWINQTDFEVLVVRYEDMIARPLDVFTKILKRAGMDVEEARVEHAHKASSFEILQRQELKSGFREVMRPKHRFFKRGTAGGWRKTLTDEQVRRIEYDHGQVMTQLGYELVNDSVPIITNKGPQKKERRMKSTELKTGD